MIAVDDSRARRIAKRRLLLSLFEARNRAAFLGGVFDQALPQPLAFRTVEAHQSAAFKFTFDIDKACRE